MASQNLLEPSIQQIEHALAKRSHDYAPRLWDHRWWTRLLLDWGTRDDQFKVQLFRFIDVLPALQTDEQFVRLLHEYFHDVRSLPTAFRWLLTRGLPPPDGPSRHPGLAIPIFEDGVYLYGRTIRCTCLPGSPSTQT